MTKRHRSGLPRSPRARMGLLVKATADSLTGVTTTEAVMAAL
jgi:hypothetical protein